MSGTSRGLAGWALAAGCLAVGTALRRYGDLGDLISTEVELSLLVAGTAFFALVGLLRAREISWTGGSDGTTGSLVASALLAAWPLVDGRTVVFAMAPLGLAALWCSGRLAQAANWAFLGLALSWVGALGLDAVALWRVVPRWVGDSLAFVLGAFGVPLDSFEGGIAFETVRAHRQILFTPALLGATCLVPLGMLVFASTWAESRRIGAELRCAFWVALACFVGMAVRVLALIAAATVMDGQQEYRNIDFPVTPFLSLPWTMAFDALGILAAALVLSLRGGPSEVVVQDSKPIPCGRLLTAVALAAGLSVGMEPVFDALGRPKQQRVMVDEAHSDWEPTDLELGREMYGQETGYNFRALVDWLAVKHGPIQRNTREIEPDFLEDVGVLVIKTPTRRFAPQEREAILEWVERGGGLLLVGDHTNVFGTGEVLNEFGEELGFRLDFDCVFDQRQRFEHVYVREPHRRTHPVLSEVPKMRFEVGCSIDLDDPAWTPVLVGRGLKNLPIDYKASNFYPSIRDASYSRYGQLCELATRAYGRGRVALVSDSTPFSTFSVMLPGRRELVEGAVDWVSRRDAGQTARSFARWLAIVLLAGGIVLLRGRGIGAAAFFLGLMLSARSLEVAVAERWLHSSSPEIDDLTRDRAVYVLAVSDTAFWPIDEFVREHDRSFDMFFQWIVRVGGWPRLELDLDVILEEARTMVLIDPPASSAPRAAEIVEAARSGATVFAIQSRPNPAVNAIAREVGCELTDLGEAPSRLDTHLGPLDLGAPFVGLQGLSRGTPLVRIEGEGPRLLSRVEVGEGSVVLGTLGALFTDEAYGERYHIVPDPMRRQLYELQYDLFAAALAEAASQPPEDAGR